MKKTLVAVAASLLSLALAGTARADAAATFQARCASCHGKDGKGKTKMGEKLNVPDLTAVKASTGEMEKVIADGKGKMSAYRGKVSDAEIKARAEYVKSGLH